MELGYEIAWFVAGVGATLYVQGVHGILKQWGLV